MLLCLIFVFGLFVNDVTPIYFAKYYYYLRMPILVIALIIISKKHPEILLSYFKYFFIISIANFIINIPLMIQQYQARLNYDFVVGLFGDQITGIISINWIFLLSMLIFFKRAKLIVIVVGYIQIFFFTWRDRSQF